MTITFRRLIYTQLKKAVIVFVVLIIELFYVSAVFTFLIFYLMIDFFCFLSPLVDVFALVSYFINIFLVKTYFLFVSDIFLLLKVNL